MDYSCPGLEGHAIMIWGRSRLSAYDALQSYHRKDEGSDTAAVHKKTSEDIQRNPNRQAIHWRVITGKDLPLDNVIISGDSVQILKEETGVTYMAGEDKDIECLAYFASWKIARKNKGHQISGSHKKKLKDAFS
jgi:hypothetical protein